MLTLIKRFYDNDVRFMVSSRKMSLQWSSCIENILFVRSSSKEIELLLVRKTTIIQENNHFSGVWHIVCLVFPHGSILFKIVELKI